METIVESGEAGSRSRSLAWLPLMLLPSGVILLCESWPPWVRMWALTASLYAGLKWMTFADAIAARKVPPGPALAYLLLWPGMDAIAFLGPRSRSRRPHATEWFSAFCKLVLGLLLIFVAAPLSISSSRLLAGWLGMIGMALFLLFGVFHLLSLCWRTAGYDAPPIMRSPLRASSLSDYWGHRWNLAFRDVAHAWVFRPLVRRVGPVGALMAVFLVSGFIHDLVISLSSRARWGLPTFYFVLQGIGILIERSRSGLRTGLGRGIAGRIFCAAVVVGPAFLLFHRPFIERVVVPTLAVLGAV
jgi:hypothetical protein